MCMCFLVACSAPANFPFFPQDCTVKVPNGASASVGLRRVPRLKFLMFKLSDKCRTRLGTPTRTGFRV